MSKKSILILAIIIPCVVFFIAKPLNTHESIQNATTSQLDANKEMLEVVKTPEETTKDKIIRLSTENGFNVNTALRIAECESQFGKYRNNWQGSSATGLYQFMPKTFNSYCQGDINNDEDQIKCFIELYEKHKNWWECKA